MIFIVSLFLWLTFLGKLSLATLIFGIGISALAQYISSKLLFAGPVPKVVFRVVLALPVAIFQAFKLIFSKPTFTVRHETVPENRIEEFGKIIAITMTPEEIVISKEEEGFLVHEVKR